MLDSLSGEPVPNARVEAFNARGMVAIAFADEEGRFKMGLDRNGTFKAVADGEGYLEKMVTINTLSFDPKTPVEALIKMSKDMDCEAPFALDGTIKTMLDDSTYNEEEDFTDATVRVMPREFTITANEEGKFALSLQPEMDYDIRIEKPGYMDRTTFVSTKGMDPGTLTMEAVLAGLSEDTSLYKIFYDYDDARIRSYAYKELDKVIDYLQRNPEVKIRLVSHADSRGTTYYNDRLSKDRTTAAYEYLRMEGIDKSRLELVWVGERKAKAVADCGGVPCSEEDYQMDRRTDIEYAGVRDLPEPKVIEMPTLGEGDTLDGGDSLDTELKEMAPDSEIVNEEGSEEEGSEEEVVEEGNETPESPEGEMEGTPDTEIVKEEAEDPNSNREAPDTEVVKEEDVEPETPEDTPEAEVVKEETDDPGTMETTPGSEVVKEEESTTPEGEKVEEGTDNPTEVVEEGSDDARMTPENDGSSDEVTPTEIIEKVVDDAIEDMETPSDTVRSMEIKVTPQED